MGPTDQKICATRTMWGVAVGMLALVSLVMGCHHNDHTNDQIREVNVLEILDTAEHVQPLYDVTINHIEDFAKAGFKVPTDPVTHGPYEYHRTGYLVTVCAVFDLPSADFDGTMKVHYGDPIVHGYGTWSHDGGHQCLTKDITPPSKDGK